MEELARLARFHGLRRDGRVAGAGHAHWDGAGGQVQGRRHPLDAAAGQPRLRQRLADDVLRAGRGAREAHVPSLRRQHVDGRAGEVMRRFVLAALLAAAVFAPPAATQIPPPSIVTDTRFAFQGVSEYDQAVGSSDVAVAAALDPARDRSYAIGTTQDGSAASQIAIVARRGDGSLDTGFAGDGSLALSVTDGKTAGGFDMLVLPDGRLRVLGRTDVSTGGTPDFDTVIAGLRPDGTPDTDFGDEGFEVFPAGSGDDEPFTIVAGPGGKLATTGSTGTDTFLAVRNADGSEVAPVKVLDRSPGRFDGGSDVAWNGDAPVVVIDAASATGMQVFLHEFRPGGFETEVVVPGADSLL